MKPQNVCLFLFALGCGAPPSAHTDESPHEPAEQLLVRYLSLVPDLEQAEARLCARNNHDRVANLFCSKPRPQVTGLVDLLRQLEVDASLSTTHFAVTTNSTATGIRVVNSLNPRVIAFDGVPRNYGSKKQFLAVGFSRGEQLVEIATRDEETGELVFYVIAFQQACNARGCTLAELLTQEIETNWLSVLPIQDIELQNTPVDCLRCHQPAGPGTRKILRMQEFSSPWTHFLAPPTLSLSASLLAHDVLLAHPREELFSGIPAALLGEKSEPQWLTSLVAQESGGTQPNEFRSAAIAVEINSGASSHHWNDIFEASRMGEAIPVPHWDSRVVDATRLKSVAAAFREATTTSAGEAVPDLRNLHSPEANYAMSIRAAPGASPTELLNQMCRHCHNSNLNPSLSRARFNVDRLEEMTPAQKQLLRTRIRLPPDDVRKMPPLLCGELTNQEVEVLEQFFQ